MKVTNIKIKEGFFNFKKNDVDRCTGCPFFTEDNSLDEWGEWDGDVVIGCALQPHSHAYANTIIDEEDEFVPDVDAEEEIFKGCPIISIEETEE